MSRQGAAIAGDRLAAAVGTVAVCVLVAVASPLGGQVHPEAGGATLLPTERRPVLLVPGWSDGKEELRALVERLRDSGWGRDSVMALEFADPVGSNVAHAGEIARAVTRLQERTGSGEVDVVAHSMGGLALRRYLLDGGAEEVRRAVFLATPHRGTVSAHLAWGEGAREMEPGSRFLLDLLRGRALPRGVRAITVRTPLDLHVIPNESATLPGLPNLEVCCPTHAGLLEDDRTFELIRRFLESR